MALGVAWAGWTRATSKQGIPSDTVPLYVHAILAIGASTTRPRLGAWVEAFDTVGRVYCETASRDRMSIRLMIYSPTSSNPLGILLHLIFTFKFIFSRASFNHNTTPRAYSRSEDSIITPIMLVKKLPGAATGQPALAAGILNASPQYQLRYSQPPLPFVNKPTNRQNKTRQFG